MYTQTHTHTHTHTEPPRVCVTLSTSKPEKQTYFKIVLRRMKSSERSFQRRLMMNGGKTEKNHTDVIQADTFQTNTLIPNPYPLN